MDDRNASFDTLLGSALMEANWREYGPFWAETEKPQFSPKYLRWRTRLLADPFAWAKKQMRPLWMRAARMAACLLLVSGLALGSLMAVSPTVRAAVLNWLREISGSQMTYSTQQTANTQILPSNWRITWLPDGWELENMTTITQRYEGPARQGTLTYACYPAGDSEMTTNVDDTADVDTVRQTITVQGCQADYYESEKYRVLLWENEEGFLFMLRSSTALDQEAFLKIAQSITYCAGPDIAYEMGWVPPEYDAMYRDELVGAAQEEWTFNQVSLIWQYVVDPICPLVLPEGEPEEILLDGLTLHYWAAEEAFEAPDSATTTVNGQPVEHSGSSISVGGVTITISGSPEDEQIGTLAWTDPDTNTSFMLEGALGREDLLHMAQSVVQTAPEPSPPAHNATMMEGTAGG